MCTVNGTGATSHMNTGHARTTGRHWSSMASQSTCSSGQMGMQLGCQVGQAADPSRVITSEQVAGKNSVSSRFHNLSPILENQAVPTQSNWINRSTNSAFHEISMTNSEVQEYLPHVVPTHYNMANNGTGPIQPNRSLSSMPQSVNASRIPNSNSNRMLAFQANARNVANANQMPSLIDFDPLPTRRADSTHIVMQARSSPVQASDQTTGSHTDQISVPGIVHQETQQFLHHRQPLYDNSQPAARVIHQFPSQIHNSAPYGQHDYDRRDIVLTDDKNTMLELINRINPCTSDHYLHVFFFFMSIMPLFELGLVPDFMLMKYLVPKVNGQMARLLLNAVSRREAFDNLCEQVRMEIFCQRSLLQLTQDYFFRNFQTASQPVGEFFERMKAAYVFLRIALNENEAVNVIMENLLPDALAALGGRAWPSSFIELFALTNIFTRQAVVLEQKLSSLSAGHANIAATSHENLVKSTRVSNVPFDSFREQETVNRIKRCFHCGDASHLRPQCPLRQPRGATQNVTALRRGASHANVICYRCHQQGHIQSSCPQANSMYGSGNALHAAK